MIGVCGLFFFIVGYARVRKDLEMCQWRVSVENKGEETNLVAALCSEV